MNKLHKLYLVEGLPGIGKTTYASRLQQTLIKEGHRAILYKEGDLHPADMAWNAYLTMDEYEEFLHNVLSIWSHDKKILQDELMERIESQTSFEDGHAIIAYTKLNFPNDSFECLYDDLAAREIYDGRLPLAEFTKLLIKRWHTFSKKALNSPNTVYIFECSFLQNHIFELMGFYDMNEDEINEHLFRLLGTVLSLNPKLIYLAPDDIEALIDTTDSIRQSDSPDESWMSQMIAYVEKTNYGKLHGLKGRTGVISFLKERYRLDQSFLAAAEAKDLELTIERHTRSFL